MRIRNNGTRGHRWWNRQCRREKLEEECWLHRLSTAKSIAQCSALCYKRKYRQIDDFLVCAHSPLQNGVRTASHDQVTTCQLLKREVLHL